MQLTKDIKQKFDDLRTYLNHKNNSQLKIESHGGNSILLIYPPEEESYYLARLKNEFPDGGFIDVAQLMNEFIDQYGLDYFAELYEAYSAEPQKLYSSKQSDSNFLNLLISRITDEVNNGKIPFLIRTGSLYGTGIDNALIIDSTAVKNLTLPLVILYPGNYVGDKLMFLNFHPASKYRSVIIN